MAVWDEPKELDTDNEAVISLYDGIKMGRSRSVAFEHNDVGDLRRKLMQLRWQRAWELEQQGRSPITSPFFQQFL